MANGSMSTRILLFGMILVFLSLSSCKQSLGGISDFYSLPAKLGEDWQMVVEIPAGTNLKLEYQQRRDAFIPDTLDGKVRVIDFLPYPGNYGFIPSTLMDEASGGDGDPVDVLLISEALPTGTVVRIHPIGTLLLVDDGETDTKIIAVPKDLSIRTFQATNYMDLSIQYQSVKRLVEDWFLNYKGPGRTESLGWRDEVYADKLIEKSRLKVEEE